MANRAVVSNEVEMLLGPDVIRAWAGAINSYPLPCIGCSEMIQPGHDDPVTISAALITPEGGEVHLTVEVILAHQRCTSRIINFLDEPTAPPQDLPQAVSLVKPNGTRAVLLLALQTLKLGIPIGSQEYLDGTIRSLLGLGLRLVTVPFFEFESGVDGWRIDIEEGGTIVIAGLDPLRITIPNAAQAPEWLDAITDQQRCLLLATAMTSNSSFVGNEATIATDLVGQLETDRLAGRLLGGVVPAAVHLPAAQDQASGLTITPVDEPRPIGRRRWLRRD